jgi:hypothetical protein
MVFGQSRVMTLLNTRRYLASKPLNIGRPPIHLTWKWHLQCALMNLAGWLLVLSSLLLLAYHMQDEAISYIDGDQAMIARP